MNSAKFTQFMMVSGLSILSFCAVLTLAIGWLDLEFPYVLNGEQAGGVANHFRNFFELLSFVSTGAVIPFAGILAFIVGYQQVNELKRSREGEEKVRAASLYLEINNRYNSQIMRDSRKTVKALRDGYEKFHYFEETPGDFFNRMLLAWSEQEVYSAPFGIYNECMRIMEFWEEIGVLIHKGLVDKAIVFDFLLGALNYTSENFSCYVENQRARNNSKTYYANALWLMHEAKKFKATEF